MTRRSRAREVVLQLLYQHDHNPRVGWNDIQAFLQRRLQQPELIRFAEKLYLGVLEHQREVDARLRAVAENWSLERMAAVDRNILRLGAYELLFCPDVPPKVALDEAIELARRYGTADSPGFVNGILDRLAAGQREPRPEPPTPPAAEA